MNDSLCHGVVGCLQGGSSPWLWNLFAKPWQKLRSYTVWHLENLGTRRGLSTLCWSLVRRQKEGGHSKLRSDKTANGQALGLQPGELVEVKPVEEILATLDRNRRHKGLLWMTGMNKYCGRQYRVYRRVQRITLESNGELRNMKNTVLLEGVTCDGKDFGGCDRSCYHFWREVWLKRATSDR